MVSDGAAAVLVCQNKKHPKQVTLRADKCGKKENVALDLTGSVASQGQALGAQGADITGTEVGLGHVCPHDAARKLVLSKFSVPPNSPYEPQRGLLRERQGGGCRTLDGNQAACQASFQNDDPFASVETPPASSCFYLNGRCLPCTLRAERRGACTNTCLRSRPTCGDATRTVFAGGPGSSACEQFATQGDCLKAWHIGNLDLDHAASCYWTGSQCEGCGLRHATMGDCTETCNGPYTCKDAARVVLAKGSSACGAYNADQTTCEKAFHVGKEGVATCWYDAAKTTCRGCGLRHELAGRCSNTCL
jgi:hypothetical protein